LNDVWNELILPRFERMNQIANTTHFTSWNDNYQKFLPTVPLELSKGFSKKRIDHRHHAMDALVIACATRDHVNLLNNQSAKSDLKRYDLQNKLRRKEPYFNEKENRQKDAFKEFLKPWETFTQDARSALENIIVSFKQNLRVINKATNHYVKWIEKDGIKMKEFIKQEGVNWAIRKPMHKDSVSGLVQLRKKKSVPFNTALDNIKDIVDKTFRKEIYSLTKNGLDKKKIVKHFKDSENQWNGQDVSKTEIYYWENDNVASRVSLNDSFDENRIINTVTDTGIQQILINHLNNCKGRLDEKGKEISASTLAFSPEGIEEMNKNIVALNNGKPHQHILKLRTYELKGNKFNVGQTGNKNGKFVETAKGTNLFFAVYQDQNNKRNYETIPLNIVIERQKQKLPSVPETNANGDKLLFHLSPNDLVYVLTEEDRNMVSIEKIFKGNEVKRIYKMVSCTAGECHFVPLSYAYPIITNECGTNNKNERMLQFFNNEDSLIPDNKGVLKPLIIKANCIKLKVDRLGEILKV
jgi:CRISPR-associated endonuclease Csn1